MDCLFCKFINREFKTDILYEDENMIVIKDIAPKAKNHYLAISKSHFKLFEEMTEKDAEIVKNMLKTIPTLKELLNLLKVLPSQVLPIVRDKKAVKRL